MIVARNITRIYYDTRVLKSSLMTEAELWFPKECKKPSSVFEDRLPPAVLQIDDDCFSITLGAMGVWRGAAAPEKSMYEAGF